MKTASLLFRSALVILLFESALCGCKEKVPSSFGLTSFVTESIDLMITPSPKGIPVNPSFVATFNEIIDSVSISDASISLVQEYDKAVIAINIVSHSNTIIITPAEDLGGGILYKLTLNGVIESIDGILLDEVSFFFTTAGAFVPKGVFAYWNFDGNANDQVGLFNPASGGIVDILYSESRNSAAGTAAEFNGETSIIEIPKGDVLMNTASFTLSFWVKPNSNGHVDANNNPAGYFVFGMAAFFGMEFEISADFSSCKFTASYDVGADNAISEDIWFSGDGKDMNHGGWQGWEYCKDLTASGGVAALLKDKWAHIVCMFDSPSKRGTIYINGEKMKAVNFGLWPAGNTRTLIQGLKYEGAPPETVNELAFGFIQSRAGTFYDNDPRYGYDFATSDHFKGQLDDIRIFHKALSENEIQLMYNSEK